MKKFLLLLTGIVMCSLYASAGGEMLFTETKLNKSHRNGWGATVKGEYVLGEHASVTLVSGYYHMAGRTTSFTYRDITAIPVKAGARYYLGSFYGAAETGAIFFSDFNKGAGFVYSFGLGDKFRLGKSVFDIGLRHEGWSVSGVRNGVIALRVGYEFMINRRSPSTRELH
jgi:hypothetical protein